MDAGDEQDELDDQDQHDHQLQQLAARQRRLLDREAADVVERLQLSRTVPFQ